MVRHSEEQPLFLAETKNLKQDVLLEILPPLLAFVGKQLGQDDFVEVWKFSSN